MQPRLDYHAHKPELIDRLRALTGDQRTFALDEHIRSLVETRVSQLNGCAYCTDLHSREARARGEKTHRLDALPVWRESPFFSAPERAALAWAEALTLLAGHPIEEAVYAELLHHFTSTEIVELSLCAGLANFWNRLAAGFRKLPVEPHPPSPCTS